MLTEALMLLEPASAFLLPWGASGLWFIPSSQGRRHVVPSCRDVCEQDRAELLQGRSERLGARGDRGLVPLGEEPALAGCAPGTVLRALVGAVLWAGPAGEAGGFLWVSVVLLGWLSCAPSSPRGEVGCKSLLYVCCSVIPSMDHANSSFAGMHLFHVPA